MADGDTSWIGAARLAVDRAGDQLATQTALDGLTRAEEDLNEALDELGHLVRAARLGRGEWWPGADAPRELRTALGDARQETAPRELGTVARLLNQFRTQSRQQLLRAWQQHLEAQLADAAQLRGLAGVLAGVPGLAKVSRHLEEVLSRLTRQHGGLPDADTVTALNQARVLLAQLEQQLPLAVQDFVSAATRGGAAVEMLSEPVLGWIEQHGASGSFKVVPGRPAGSQGG